MSTTLAEIVSATRRRIIDARHSADLRDLEKRAQEHTPRGFRRALGARAAKDVAVIAELKKASPSRGLIRADFSPGKLAAELEAAGAAALSVLTDEPYFQGSLDNLRLASGATKIPCLRKDFIVDEFQLLEALAYRADAVLLIAAALSKQELVGLAIDARDYGLDVLCEVHDEEELERALNAGFNLIGVNSRDLRTFEVDLDTAFRLSTKMPKDVIKVAESGIHSGADISHLRAAGYQAFLIGESLMNAESPGDALRWFLKESSPVAAN